MVSFWTLISFVFFLQIGVLAFAALAFAEPEADPAYLYRGYYGGFRPYWGYGYGLPW